MAIKVFKNTLIYITGDVINKVIPFSLLPLLTKTLTQEEYGQYSLFGVIISLLTIFIGYGMHSYVSNQFYKFDKMEINNVINNIIYLLIGGVIIFVPLLYIFKNMVLTYTNIEYVWIIVALLSAFFQFITSINLMIFIAENQAKYFTIYQLSQSIFSFASMYIFVFVINYGMEGALLSVASSLIVFGFLSLIILYKRGFVNLNIPFDFAISKRILKFGLPLIPHYLAGWIKVSIDRVFLSSLGLATVGLFSISYQLAMVVSILLLAINKVWSPYLLKELSTNIKYDQKVKIVKQTYLSWIAIIVLFIIIYTLILLIFPYVINVKYNEAKDIFLFIMIGFLFDGMYYFIAPYILHEEQTLYLTYISIFSAIIHLLISFIGIKYYGLHAALVSIIVSNCIFFTSTWILANKVYPMPWNLRKKNK